MSEVNHPEFDKEEQAILSALVPELEPMEEVPQDQPGDIPTPTEEEAKPEAITADEQAQTSAPAVATTAVEATPPKGETRAALRASRHSEKKLREELEVLRQENEALKQGKGPVDTSITDEEIAELEESFPLQAKIVRKQRELEQKLTQSMPAPSTEFEPLIYNPAVQEVIDNVPDLLAWQYDPASQDKFQRAIQYDKALLADPDWKDRSATERFEEAARRTKAAMSTPPTPSSAAKATRNDPTKVIEAAQANGPKGISDFRGGAPATAPAINYEGMSDEKIMASLPVT